jgi:hypothetical protein
MSGPSVVLKGVEDEWRRASRPKGGAAPTSPQTLPPAQRLHPTCQAAPPALWISHPTFLQPPLTNWTLSESFQPSFSLPTLATSGLRLELVWSPPTRGNLGPSLPSVSCIGSCSSQIDMAPRRRELTGLDHGSGISSCDPLPWPLLRHHPGPPGSPDRKSKSMTTL